MSAAATALAAASLPAGGVSSWVRLALAVPAGLLPWGVILAVAYLRHTGTHVEQVYQFEKAGAFIGAGTPESRDFTAARLGDGANMLRDMIYTAWVDSAQPVP